MIEKLPLFIRGGKGFYTTMVVYGFDAVVTRRDTDVEMSNPLFQLLYSKHMAETFFVPFNVSFLLQITFQATTFLLSQLCVKRSFISLVLVIFENDWATTDVTKLFLQKLGSRFRSLHPQSESPERTSF